MKIGFLENLLLSESQLEKDTKVVNDILFTWTGKCTGRSPNAKKIERDPLTEHIDWQNNTAISSQEFDEYWHKFYSFLVKNSEQIYRQNVSAVRDPRRSLNVDIYTEHAKHSMFARNMFTPRSSLSVEDGYEVFHFPSLLDEPTVLISVSKRKILISGTLYSGEIKKSVFTVLNFHFPDNDELPMHCSVNVNNNRKNPAIFFGLSGTGKTTLSADPNRILIGDDEHAWTRDGLTNFEGGCYAKTFNLSQVDEPEIWKACHTKGAIIENVPLTPKGNPDFSSDFFTENGRASYPADSIPNADKLGYVDEHPQNIIMLTCDAFGVLPPVSRLSASEAVDHFSLGYTAKVAGTESGITEPVATFSPCFGGPFMPLHVSVYANILRNKIHEHNVNCWLVNTGWTGGGYGVGERISINVTRKIIDAIHSGELAKLDTFLHEYSGLTVPNASEDLIPNKVLIPELGWKNKEQYEKSIAELLNLFKEQKLKKKPWGDNGRL